MVVRFERDLTEYRIRTHTNFIANGRLGFESRRRNDQILSDHKKKIETSVDRFRPSTDTEYNNTKKSAQLVLFIDKLQFVQFTAE